MIWAISAVARVQMTRPRNPWSRSVGERPMWSMCPWVSTSASIDRTSKGKPLPVAALEGVVALVLAAVDQDAGARRPRAACRSP